MAPLPKEVKKGMLPTTMEDYAPRALKVSKEKHFKFVRRIWCCNDPWILGRDQGNLNPIIPPWLLSYHSKLSKAWLGDGMDHQHQPLDEVSLDLGRGPTREMMGNTTPKLR